MSTVTTSVEQAGRIAPVAAAAIALLDQCASFAGSVGASAYTGESRTIRGGTIGKHVRHTLDHFRACLNGAGSVADYDRRQRRTPVESDPDAALAEIRLLRSRLQRVNEGATCRAMRVRVMLSSDGTQAELASTLGRELAFAAHHAIHHHAMMAAIAAEFGIVPEEGFGKAPSTIDHERRRG